VYKQTSLRKRAANEAISFSDAKFSLLGVLANQSQINMLALYSNVEAFFTIQ